MRPGIFLQAAAQELRYVWRWLIKNPGFAASAVAVISIGVGASTAVFSVVDRVLFRSLPYAQDGRLVSVGVTAPIEPQEFMLGRQYFAWKDHQTPFEALTSWSGVTDCDITTQNPVRVGCARVESNFLETLGVQPIVGRNFTRAEDQPHGPHVAIISHALWQGRFAGDQNVIDKTISLNGEAHVILGVLPHEFELPTLAQADILLPQRLNEALQRSSGQGAVLSVFARLKPRITMVQAGAQLQPLLQDFIKSVPPQFRKEVKLRIRSIRDRQVQEAKTASWLLLGSVLTVLLIACANVANLLLARSASRQRELAIQTALGASRGRLALRALAESLSICVIGGGAGCIFSFLLIRSLVTIAPQGIPHLREATLDLRVLAFALMASIASAGIVGLIPALQRVGPEALSGGHVVETSRGWFRQMLIIGQVAGSLVLLFSAALLLRTLWNVENNPLGMNTGGVLTSEIVLNPQLYPTPSRQLAFFEELEADLRHMPGIKTIALSDSLPPVNAARSTIYASIAVEGQPKFAEGTGGTVVWRAVTPDYFSALGVSILRGRSFHEEDRTPGGNVIILGQMLARRLFPNEDALGKRIQVNSAPPWFTIVGVVGDVRNNGIVGKDQPEYYLLRSHAPDYGLGQRIPADGLRRASLIVQTSGAPQAVERWLQAEIHRIDPTLPVNIATMDQRVGTLAQRPRFSAVLLGLFAAMALAMASVGLYGLMSFFVVQRTHEIGVRMALGATPPNIVRLVLGYAARWTVAGLLIGLAGAFLAARALQSVLFHVDVKDPWLICLTIMLLMVVALAAAWIPSWRASRVDPLVALREG